MSDEAIKKMPANKPLVFDSYESTLGNSLDSGRSSGPSNGDAPVLPKIKIWTVINGGLYVCEFAGNVT